ncbi:hypothetical protein BGY98DRAFT_1179876 [Russula aff. rugulosa BPL654]|nr:hypothetical protein BGY98DRAFT_1179876 [Russula aff. rugulosa BPL654]
MSFRLLLSDFLLALAFVLPVTPQSQTPPGRDAVGMGRGSGNGPNLIGNGRTVHLCDAMIWRKTFLPECCSSVQERQQIDYWYGKSCVLERWRCDNSEAELEVGGVDDDQHARDSMNDWRVEPENEALVRELLSSSRGPRSVQVLTQTLGYSACEAQKATRFIQSNNGVLVVAGHRFTSSAVTQPQLLSESDPIQAAFVPCHHDMVLRLYTSARQVHLGAHTVMVTEGGTDVLRISGESGLAAMLNGL